MAEAPSLFPTPVETTPPPGRGLHGYYRKPNGWIVLAPTSPSNRSGYEYKGFTLLPQYGEFRNGTNEPQAKKKERDDRGNPWNPAVEPWRLIFQRDGAKEFTVEQIIAFHWHLTPPYREVSFPQLEGVEITVYPCPECEKGTFSSVKALEASDQLRTHLTSGINKRHEYTPTDLRELGKELKIDFDSARVGRMQQVKEQMAPTKEPLDLTLSEPIKEDEEPTTADVSQGRAKATGDPPPCEFDCGWVSEALPPMWEKSVSLHQKIHCKKNPDSLWSKKQEPVLA